MKETWAVRFRVSGLSVEKLLNAARQQGMTFFRVKREKNRDMVIACPPQTYRVFRALAEEKGYQVGEARPVGLLGQVRRLGRRGGLIAGIGAAVVLIALALSFVWQVRVENAGPYEGEVRSYLAELGVVPGIPRVSVHLDELREKLEWRLPKVKWVRVEWAGVALRVALEEGTPPPEGEGLTPVDVIASEDGVLKRLTTYAGTPQAQAGDLVRAGQVLIKGEERGKDGEIIPVRARGEAVARVWYSVSVRLPLTEYVSIPTGRISERRLIETPFFVWSREEAPDYLTADRERDYVTVGGAWLPVRVARERYAEVRLEKNTRDPEEVKKEGEKAAVLALNRALIHDETVDKWINFSMIEGDNIIVTATAEILRDIGRSGP